MLSFPSAESHIHLHTACLTLHNLFNFLREKLLVLWEIFIYARVYISCDWSCLVTVLGRAIQRLRNTDRGNNVFWVDERRNG